ncbi:MAG: general secretion pathway protein A [Candidatus Omnitrophota bacterium]|jgi:general secretion pathway protein A
MSYYVHMYKEYFGFETKPFSITSDPAFLFYSKKHREALNVLHYGIKDRVGFIEITGDIGCGKTTLCRAIIAELPPSVKTAYLFNSSLTEMQFLQTFVADLGLDTLKKNRYQLFADLNNFLISQLRNNANVVLIIDESQNLSMRLLEQIRMLSNLETDTDKLLQIVLVGQPELRQKLDHPLLTQLKQRIAIRCHITPLTADEVGGYIKHRLQKAGRESKQALFDDEAVAQIYAFSQGVPRLINMICDKALLGAYAKQCPVVNQTLLIQSIQEHQGALV